MYLISEIREVRIKNSTSQGQSVPVDVVADQGRIQQNAKPLAGNQEQDVEENVQDVPERRIL